MRSPALPSTRGRLFSLHALLPNPRPALAPPLPAPGTSTRSRLLALQAKLAAVQADADHTLAEALPLQAELDAIDAER